jgi:tetratricopeptide (TPR) repeat protein
VVLARSRRQADAIRLLEQTRASNPDVGPLLVFLGQLYIEGQRFDEALPLLDRAVRLDPGNTDALAARGQLHAQNRRADQSLRDFQAALSGDPNNTIALQGMGFIAYASRDFGAAIGFLEHAQRLQPGNIDVVLLLARSLGGAQRYDEGVAAYKRVGALIQQQGGPAVEPQLMMERGFLEIRAGRLEDAIKSADQVAQLNDNDPLPWILRAEIAAVQKRKDDAFEAFEKAWKRGFRSQDFIQQTEFYRLLRNSPRYKRLTGR